MYKRKYFILSLLLVICALFSEAASEAYYSKSTYQLARSLTMSEAARINAKIESDESLSKGTIFQNVGFAFAALSFLSLIISKIRHEPAVHLILLLLLCLYALLLLVMV